MFTIIQDAFVITYMKGIYKQRKVYQRNNRLYIEHGSAFLGLLKTGCTGPDMSIDEKILPFEPGADKMGFLTVPESFNNKKEKKNAR